jgi:hypothetical protein
MDGVGYVPSDELSADEVDVITDATSSTPLLWQEDPSERCKFRQVSSESK